MVCDEVSACEVEGKVPGKVEVAGVRGRKYVRGTVWRWEECMLDEG